MINKIDKYKTHVNKITWGDKTTINSFNNKFDYWS